MLDVGEAKGRLEVPVGGRDNCRRSSDKGCVTLDR